MTVADFLDAFKTKASVSIFQDGKSILEVRNVDGLTDRLSADISGATIETIDILGSTAIGIKIEDSAP